MNSKKSKPKHKLTKKEKRGVQNWLKLHSLKQKNECPFTDCLGWTCQDICDSWFPTRDGLLCPCSHHDLPEVIRRAKEMIK